MYLYKAQIIDEENDEVITEISGHSEESLEEEMGKSKWTRAIKDYENENHLRSKLY
jgi:ribosomal protein L18